MTLKDKLYYLDPEDIPCTLDRLVTSRELLPEHLTKLAALECGEALEVLWPGDLYGDTIVCCGTARHVAAHQTLWEHGATRHLSDAGSWMLARKLIETIDGVS
jgi:hypothetical protein